MRRAGCVIASLLLIRGQGIGVQQCFLLGSEIENNRYGKAEPAFWKNLVGIPNYIELEIRYDYPLKDISNTQIKFSLIATDQIEMSFSANEWFHETFKVRRPGIHDPNHVLVEIHT